MATDAITIGASRDDARPYPPSWIDRLIAAVRRAPLPAPVIYLAAMIPSILLANSANWVSGIEPVGRLTFFQTFWGVWTIGFIWVMDHLNSVAAASFDAFRPAISAGAADLERARYELTVIPARAAIAMTLVAVVFTLGYYAADPVASGIVGLSPLALAGRAVSETFSTALMLNLVLHAFRQLRLVRRLHADADRVDLFHPAPVYAFSRLTAQTGIVLIAIVSLGYIGNPVPIDRTTFVALWLPWLAGFPALAVAIFVVPLIGMHDRLAAMKLRLQGEGEERLKSILGELNRDVDAIDLARADGLQKTLASLVQQREILARLPTWPWSTGTARGFGSALLLPLFLFMLQRALLQILHV